MDDDDYFVNGAQLLDVIANVIERHTSLCLDDEDDREILRDAIAAAIEPIMEPVGDDDE